MVMCKSFVMAVVLLATDDEDDDPPPPLLCPFIVVKTFSNQLKLFGSSSPRDSESQYSNSFRLISSGDAPAPAVADMETEWLP